jgi:hypothetical protein
MDMKGQNYTEMAVNTAKRKEYYTLFFFRCLKEITGIASIA